MGATNLSRYFPCFTAFGVRSDRQWKLLFPSRVWFESIRFFFNSIRSNSIYSNGSFFLNFCCRSHTTGILYFRRLQSSSIQIHSCRMLSTRVANPPRYGILNCGCAVDATRLDTIRVVILVQFRRSSVKAFPNLVLCIPPPLVMV